MRVQTFMGKVSVEGLRQMDEQINEWLDSHQVEPRFIQQCYGDERHHEVTSQEPVVIITVWY